MAMTKGIMGLVYTAYSWEEGIKPLAEKPGVLWKQHQTLLPPLPLSPSLSLPLSLSHQSRLHFLTKSIQQQKNNVANWDETLQVVRSRNRSEPFFVACSSYPVYWLRVFIMVLSRSGAEPKLFVFGSGSTFVPYFGLASGSQIILAPPAAQHWFSGRFLDFLDF